MVGECSRAAADDGAVRVHVMVVHQAESVTEKLVGFAERLAADALPLVEEATGRRWEGAVSGTTALADQEPRSAVGFLDHALLRMVQSPADLVLVITDAPLLSEDRTVVPGLASPAANVVVVSTAKLVEAPFGHPVRAVDEPVVRWNAAALVVHLLGHLLDLGHEDPGMAAFRFDPDRSSVEPLRAGRNGLREAAGRLREHEGSTPNLWRRVQAHVDVSRRRPGVALGPALRSRAPLLPLRLGRLSAAAVAPTFIILFTDEFWWAAIHLPRWHVWLTAALAVVVGTWFLLVSQRLLFPHRDRNRLTRHVALTNVAVAVNTLLLTVGLLLLVTFLVLLVQLLLFPADYLQAWFDGEFEVTWSDRIHLAVIVGALGTLTGALGGSFHGRALLREYGIFLSHP